MNDAKYAHITALLCQQAPSLMGIYLFGSRANGAAHAHSDYDIAVLTEKPGMLDGMRRLALAAELSEILGKPVDLIDLQAAPTDLRFVIISTARRLYCKDKYFCDFFEMTVYSMYQDLELFRRHIISDIKQRGTVYGR